MSIELNIKSLKSANNDIKVNHLPCEIQHNGEAKVTEYFDSIIRKVENTTSENKDEESKCTVKTNYG